MTGARGRLWANANGGRLELQSDAGDAQIVWNDTKVTVYDAFGNVSTVYRGTMQISSSDPTVGGYYTFTAADAGVHTFTVALTKAGTPIPIQDIWIAAQAIQTGSILVTYDRHFLRVAGLRIWAELE